MFIVCKYVNICIQYNIPLGKIVEHTVYHMFCKQGHALSTCRVRTIKKNKKKYREMGGNVEKLKMIKTKKKKKKEEK